jgi:hypothetical protein
VRHAIAIMGCALLAAPAAAAGETGRAPVPALTLPSGSGVPALRPPADAAPGGPAAARDAGTPEAARAPAALDRGGWSAFGGIGRLQLRAELGESDAPRLNLQSAPARPKGGPLNMGLQYRF